jgi:hypothetical protein
MSGGSLNYIYLKLESEIHNIEDTSPEVKAFKSHLVKVVKALHDIEWVQSGDYSEGQELESIRACISNIDIIDNHIKEAEKIIEELQDLIKISRTAKIEEEPEQEIYITNIEDLQIEKVYEFVWGSKETPEEQLIQQLTYKGKEYEINKIQNINNYKMGEVPKHYKFETADCVWPAPVELRSDKLSNALEKKTVTIKEVK